MLWRVPIHFRYGGVERNATTRPSSVSPLGVLLASGLWRVRRQQGELAGIRGLPVGGHDLRRGRRERGDASCPVPEHTRSSITQTVRRVRPAGACRLNPKTLCPTLRKSPRRNQREGFSAISEESLGGATRRGMPAADAHVHGHRGETIPPNVRSAVPSPAQRWFTMGCRSQRLQPNRQAQPRLRQFQCSYNLPSPLGTDWSAIPAPDRRS